MQPRAQTLQMKLGFFDDDLKKPKHDELMVWLDQNKLKILNDIYNKDYFISLFEKEKNDFNIIKENTILDLKIRYDREHNEDNKFDLHCSIQEVSELKFENILNDKNMIHKIEKARAIWEKPIITGYGNKYIVGFIDCEIRYRVPLYSIPDLEHSIYGDRKLVFNRNPKNIKCNIYNDDDSIFVEVKTEIKSIGELIRQINHYKEYQNGDYYVLCPNNPYSEILAEQKIYTIEYKKY